MAVLHPGRPAEHQDRVIHEDDVGPGNDDQYANEISSKMRAVGWGGHSRRGLTGSRCACRRPPGREPRRYRARLDFLAIDWLASIEDLFTRREEDQVANSATDLCCSACHAGIHRALAPPAPSPRPVRFIGPSGHGLGHGAGWVSLPGPPAAAPTPIFPEPRECAGIQQPTVRKHRVHHVAGTQIP